MKPRFNPLRYSLAASLAIGFSVTSASATSYYFDGGTVDINTNGNGASAGASGNWNTTVKNWDQGVAAHFVWNNVTNAADTAVFGTTNTNTRTVTVSGTVVADTIQMGALSWRFTGGTIDANNFDATTKPNTSVDSNLTGTINFKATGSTDDLSKSGAVIINGNNTGLTSTTVNLNADANHIILNHAGALGADGAVVQITKGAVNLGNNAVPNNNVPISYNAWATDLAGTIRGRFSESTWNGATNLTGDSQLMTRASAGVKLIFSSTGTIDLNDKTLSLYSSSTAAGIDLNGVISGTGNLETGEGFGTLGSSDNANGTTTLNANNTYTGDTLVNNGTLVLSSTGGLKFDIGLDGVNNQITGSGKVTLDGLFTFDLTGASTTLNDSWNIVNVATLIESYGSNFDIFGFTPDGGGDLWNGESGGAFYQFSETSGVLTVVPEPNVAALFAGLGTLALLRRRRA